MHREELEKELLMDYYELSDYLIGKYGPAKYDYFCNDSFRTVNKKASRSNEGLQCHHIDEDKCGSLSSPQMAKRHPFEYQKKERLVYCNLIEHCLLHYKICASKQTYAMDKPIDIADFFTSGGLFNTSNMINGLYCKKGSSIPYQQCYYEQIQENYYDYIWMLKLFILNVYNLYVGEQTEQVINLNKVVDIEGEKGVVTGFSNTKEMISVQFENGRTSTVVPDNITGLSCFDYLEQMTRRLSSGREGKYYEKIYKDIMDSFSVSSDEDAKVLEEWKRYGEQIVANSVRYYKGQLLDTSFNKGKQFVRGELLFDKRYGLGTITKVTMGYFVNLLTIDFELYGERTIPIKDFVKKNGGFGA